MKATQGVAIGSLSKLKEVAPARPDFQSVRRKSVLANSPQ